METKKTTFKLFAYLMLLMAVFYAACSEDKYDPKVNLKIGLEELIITNGGLKGDITYEGIIDYASKTILFEDVAAETNLGKIKFNGKIGIGTAPEFTEYDFAKNQTQFIRFINGGITEEYEVTMKINAPIMDAQLDKLALILGDGETEAIITINHESKKIIVDAKNQPKVFLQSVAALPAYAAVEFTKIDGSSIMTEDPGIVKVGYWGRTTEYSFEFTYIPPTGADFKLATLYDFSANDPGNPLLIADIKQGFTRSAWFDGQNVFLPIRTESSSNSLVSLSLKAVLEKDLSQAVNLNKTGSESWGWWPTGAGVNAGGHFYTINQTTMSMGGVLSLRYWENAGTEYKILKTFTDATQDVRYGDNMSINIDKNGNGFIYLIRLDGQKLIRYAVSAYETISDPVMLNMPGDLVTGLNSGLFNIKKIDDQGNTTHLNEYLTAVNNTNKIKLIDKDANLIVESGISLPASLQAAHIVNYNNARYLILLSTSGKAELNVYDISYGETTKEGIDDFMSNTDARKLVYKTSLGTYSGYGNIICTEVINEKLYLFAFSGNAGFVMVEIPKNTDLD